MLRYASQLRLHQYFLADLPWEDASRKVYQPLLPETLSTPGSGFLSIRRFRSDQSLTFSTSWIAKIFSPLFIREIQHLPDGKCPANSSMVSHAINIAIFSLNGYNRLRSDRKAKERPGSGQGKAKGLPAILQQNRGQILGFGNYKGKLESPLLLVTA